MPSADQPQSSDAEGLSGYRQQVARLQEIALWAVERDGEDLDEHSDEYASIRKSLFENEVMSAEMPPLIRDNTTLFRLYNSLSNSKRSPSDRKHIISNAFSYLLSASLQVDASTWTGVQSHLARMQILKNFIPTAQEALGQLIAELEERGNNGGPPLDSRAEALECLRELHHLLGHLLYIIDDDVQPHLANGLIGETIAYAKRATSTLKNDPMPYAVSTMLLALLTAVGMPNAAGLASATALSFMKKQN